MWSSPLFWIVFAIAVFWALGAYNRLMRLRSAVVQAFGSFDAHMVRLLALLGEFGAAHAVQQLPPAGGMAPEMAALQGATTQLSASLAMARARPLQSEAVAALVAAREVLHASWQKAVPNLPGDNNAQMPALADAADLLPRPALLWQMRWDEHVQQNDQATRVFNDAVLHYNAAIAQFPANLLAWVFGFKAARRL
ncbi:LemA family protein [Acidovorax sp. Root267]|uniref:LemA family protein n=1 Tax=Acidovorax sp. Root267 TaxID=1736505 RepID=UPI00070C0927|nr:LemA family protein [Acidovorax sp. Root267]KRD21092.1 LemA family protein [Acidovorax sp. Root267]